jgi:hypothetical protein
MDAFEGLVSEILWREGYWVQTSLKVDLAKEERVAIGRPSSPRWEIDVVGYSGRRNELLVVECKSYLDSMGVSFSAFDGGDEKLAGRFKLFNDRVLWDVVRKRLCRQLFECGLITEQPNVRLALVCGKIIRPRDRELLKERFEEEG